MMKTTRRELLAGAGALGGLALLPGAAHAAPADAAQTLLAGIAEEILTDFPETALYLGIDEGPRAALRGRFADRSHDADHLSLIHI